MARRQALGPVEMLSLACDPGLCENAWSRRGIPQVYTLLLQIQGVGQLSHYGHDTILHAGDCLLSDNAAPCSYRVEMPGELLLLRIPAGMLREYVPTPESFCGLRLAVTEGLTDMLSRVALSLWAALETGLSEELQLRGAHHLLDLLASCYAVASDARVTTSSSLDARHAWVRRHIEQHLRDPQLSPRTVAGGLRLSSRYLRMIFAQRQESVSAYILRRRLEECAQELSDAHAGARSITQIAFSWGFNSASHFTRSFHQRYGLSPRDFRRERLARPPGMPGEEPGFQRRVRRA